MKDWIPEFIKKIFFQSFFELLLPANLDRDVVVLN